MPNTPDLLPELPPLTRLEGQDSTDNILRSNVANAMKQPALATMGELVRNDPVLFEQVGALTGRRQDFKADYDRPGRVVAPWFAGIARHDPDLLDTALDAHFDLESEVTHERLKQDAMESGYSYWPVLVVGTGPQSQIFNAQLTTERPDIAKGILVVDEEQTVGGTFRSSEGMNFRLNSRTRKQTDDKPVPGTKGNINTLRPGVATLGDVTAETYAQADELGRTIRVNHALNNTSMGLGLKVVGIVPEDPGLPTGLKGSTSVIVQGEDEERFTIRTDLLVASSGIGEPNLERFDTETKTLIEEERAKMEAGERPKVVLYSDLYTMMQQDDFPLRDIKRVGVIGEGDSARTAIGTLLGYEPRTDNSVTQLDTVEEIVWFGQSSFTDEDFVSNNRLRYAQLGLEFPREADERRATRITGDSDDVESIELNDDGTKAVIDDVQDLGEYDLVVITTGFKNRSEQWLEESFVTPLEATSTVVQEAIDPAKPETVLEAGAVIDFPLGFNIQRAQILGVMKDEADQPVYKISFQTNSGDTVVGDLAAKPQEGMPSLADYCRLENFSEELTLSQAQVRPNRETEPRKPEALTAAEFSELGFEDKVAFLEKGPFFFAGSTAFLQTGLGKQKIYKVSGVNSLNYTATLAGYSYDTSSQTLEARGETGVDLGSFITDMSDIDEKSRGLVINPVLEQYAGNLTGRVQRLTGLEASSQLETLADQGAVICFTNPVGIFNLVSLYRTKDGEIKYGFQYRETERWEIASRFNKQRLDNALLDQIEVRVITPGDNVTGETLAPAKKPEGITGRDLKQLDFEQAQEYIQPNSVVFIGNGRFLVARSSLRRDLSFDVVELGRSPETGLIKDTGFAGSEFSYSVSNIGNRSAVINNPALLESNLDKNTVLDLEKDEIFNRLEEFYKRRAVIVSTTGGYLPLVAPIADDNAAYAENSLSVAVEDDLYTPNRLRNNTPGLRSSLWNRVIIPNVEAGRVGNMPDLYRQRVSGRPQLTEVRGPGDKPIAKQVQNQPIYLVGPAAGLPVSPEVLELIPDIPQNTVSLFGSQPRTTQLAGSLALTLPLGLSQSRSEVAPVEAPVDREEGDKAVTKITIPADFEVTLPSAAKRMAAPELLFFGLGTRARQLGITNGTDEVAGAKVSIEKSPGGDISVRITNNKSGGDILSKGALSQLFAMPHTVHALRRMLNGNSRASRLNLELPFDARGLQVGNIGFSVERDKKPRPVRTRPETK